MSTAIPMPPEGERVAVDLRPGRWVVEVREDGTWTATRVQGEDGTPTTAEALPDVTALFRRRRATAARLRDALDRRANS